MGFRNVREDRTVIDSSKLPKRSNCFRDRNVTLIIG